MTDTSKWPDALKQLYGEKEYQDSQTVNVISSVLTVKPYSVDSSQINVRQNGRKFSNFFMNPFNSETKQVIKPILVKNANNQLEPAGFTIAGQPVQHTNKSGT